MSEEVKIKISQPMFEVGELERFDNNIHNIVAEYSKLMFKEKDQILTQRIIMKQEEEIERLKEQLNDEIQEELKQSEIMVKKQQEIERLHSIIKEVREYIKRLTIDDEYMATLQFTYGDRDNILKLLDKGE